MLETERVFKQAVAAYPYLAIIPLRGKDGKAPCVGGFDNWRRRPSDKTYASWAARFADANVGVLTGPLNDIVVLDIDNIAQTDALIELYGSTTLMVRTPSGGLHAYYRNNGEGCRSLRPEFDADIKGVGGYVAAPPSRRLSTGVRYAFEQGSFHLRKSLPFMKHRTTRRGRISAAGVIRGGDRNNALFQRLLAEVRYVDTLDDLLDVAQTFNDHCCEPPLGDSEVVKTTQSAWKRECEGKNWRGRGQVIPMPATDLDVCLQEHNGANAYVLDGILRRYHDPHDTFAICPKAMSGATLPWSVKRIREARNTLEDRGLIVRVEEGGQGPGKPHRFRFSCRS